MRALVTALLFLAVQSSVVAQDYPVTGMVVRVDRSRQHFYGLDSGDPWLHVSDDDAVRG